MERKVTETSTLEPLPTDMADNKILVARETVEVVPNRPFRVLLVNLTDSSVNIQKRIKLADLTAGLKKIGNNRRPLAS